MHSSLRAFVASLALLSFMLPVTNASARELPGSFADVVEKLSPAVVNISTTQKVKGGVQMFGLPLDQFEGDPQMDQFRQFFEQFGQMQGGKNAPEREVTSLGSGFIIDASGFVITNNHVVEQAEEITVILTDNSKHKAKIIGRDKKTDLALLKIEAKKPLPFVTLGDSDKMRVGDWVLAVGNPYGLGGSVTQGIISARQRSINAGPFDDFLQTDAPINRGNSGGPLFNMAGEVVGINTAIFSPTGGNVGIGFSIPANIAKPVIEQLKQFGRTHRAWLGVKIQEVSDEIAESVGLPAPKGAMVADVTKGSPSASAGVQQGDIIVKFDGKDIAEMRFLPRMVAETPIGKKVDIVVWRKGKEVSLTTTLTEMPDDEDDAPKPKQDSKKQGGETVLGLKITPLTPALRDRYKLDAKLEGLLVTGITENSEAAKRGLSEGDVITQAGNEVVKSVEELKKQLNLAQKAGRKFLLLKVVQGGETAFVTVPVGK